MPTTKCRSPYCIVMLLLLGTVAQGQEPSGAAAPLLVASQSVHDNLERIQAAKKGVEVVLKSGKSYRGTIAALGDHAVVLTEIQGREFYDALVVLDDVVALEVRARGTP